MKIENANLSLEVSLKAAEMHSLIFKPSGKEWIWSGDPTFWSGRNPILFPIIGSTYDKKIRIDGQEFVMGNHGFTRNADFVCELHSEDEIRLSFSFNPVTLSQFPFEFKLSVTYKLCDDHVQIIYDIDNLSAKDMPFSFGLHPAFLHSANGADAPICVEFPCLETGLPQSILNHPEKQVLAFTDAFFETTPTLILSPVASPYVTLIDEEDRVDVSCMGYRWLAFWKKPKAHFLCIEPWHGHDDFGVVTADFKDREGTIILAPGRRFTTSYDIRPYRK
jgi:galactose mutarotase-like enzyme